MAVRDTAIPGAPCWVDLMTSDTDRAREFYGAVLGWESEEPNPEFGGYFNFTKSGVRVAGGMTAEPQNPDTWSVYLATEDAEKTLEAAAAHGAQIIVNAMPVADIGVMGFLVDPTGAAIGIWQPKLHQGFGVVTEPGAPSWFELHTRDYATALTFYREVFSWETRVESDTDDFRYTTLVSGEESLAGVMDATGHLPEGAAPFWAVYFGVDDTDAAVTRVTQHGGSVLTPAADTPYGRIAEVADPTGASFRLVAGNEAMPAR